MLSLFRRQPCQRLSTLPSLVAGGGQRVSGEDVGGEDGDGVNTGCRSGSDRHGAHSTAVAAPAAASASPELHFHALDPKLLLLAILESSHQQSCSKVMPGWGQAV